MFASNQNSSDRPRVLLIAYQFPPVGGAGVQRVAKFTKYLPAQGWDVSVLTVSNPSVPVADSSLLREIPAATVIRTARTWEPGYAFKSSLAANGAAAEAGGAAQRCLGAAKRWAKSVAAAALQPDPQILWTIPAQRAGRRLLSEMRHDAILASGPPFSSFLLGASLARASGLPLVVDYRDEWTISNRYWENKSNSGWARWCAANFQTRVLRQASHVVATTEQSAAALREEARRVGATASVSCVWNGFDPEDLECSGAAAVRFDDRYRLSHVGTLWRLTSPGPLVAAIERLAERTPRLATRLELEFLGRCTGPEQEALAAARLGGVQVTQRDYVEHSAAVASMRAADELCVLLSNVPEATRVMPAKCFEYLATGRPILSIAPGGELQRVLAEQPGVASFAPDDIAGICDHLARRLQLARDERPIARDVSRFDRAAQAGQLAALLNQVRNPAASAA